MDRRRVDEGDVEDLDETYEIFRVICPDCAQPIALLADEEVLPEHALCPSPWNPFGLTVCPGPGAGRRRRRRADASLDGRTSRTWRCC